MNYQRGQCIFFLLQLFETWIVFQIYLSAIKRGNHNHKTTFNEALFILILPISTKIHNIFNNSLHNDCFSVTFGYIAILFLQKSQVFLCLLFYR